MTKRQRKGAAMNIFFDTEFTDLSKQASLISVGFVSETGNELYLESADFAEHECSPFVMEHVLPLLHVPLRDRLPLPSMGDRIAAWIREIGGHAQLVSDSGWDVEFLKLCFLQLGGIRSVLPNIEFSQVFFDDDVAARRYNEAYEEYFKRRPDRQHHALDDARAIRQGWLAASGFYY